MIYKINENIYETYDFDDELLYVIFISKINIEDDKNNLLIIANNIADKDHILNNYSNYEYINEYNINVYEDTPDNIFDLLISDFNLKDELIFHELLPHRMTLENGTLCMYSISKDNNFNYLTNLDRKYLESDDIYDFNENLYDEKSVELPF